MNYETIGIFPVPIYVSELVPPTESELQFINSIQYRPNMGGNNVTSIDDNVLSKLPKLSSQIQQHLDNYIQKIILPKNKLSLYVTQSWVNKNEKETQHRKHIHTNSIISGVYYITENPEPIRFFKHFDHLESWNIELDRYGEFNYYQWVCPVKKNNLVLFPSILAHCVNKNTLNEPRLSLAFNTFFRGILGEKDSYTYLELN